MEWQGSSASSFNPRTLGWSRSKATAVLLGTMLTSVWMFHSIFLGNDNGCYLPQFFFFSSIFFFFFLQVNNDILTFPAMCFSEVILQWHGSKQNQSSRIISFFSSYLAAKYLIAIKMFMTLCFRLKYIYILKCQKPTKKDISRCRQKFYFPMVLYHCKFKVQWTIPTPLAVWAKDQNLLIIIKVRIEEAS